MAKFGLDLQSQFEEEHKEATPVVKAVKAKTKPKTEKPKTKNIVEKEIKKERKKPGPKTNKKAQKAASDYLRLDLVTEKTNYKEYLKNVSEKEGVTITKYIQMLIDKDIKKYERKNKDV